MPETTEEWWERVSAALERDGYRPWQSAGWTTWPFDGELAVRPLQPPTAGEQLRNGAGGVDCAQCDLSRRDDPRDYVFWRDELMMLGTPFGGTSLPFLAFLMPRRHTDLSDLTPAEAARMGELQMLVERAVTEVLDVPRLHVIRWGDGSEHLHWWLYG